MECFLCGLHECVSGVEYMREPPVSRLTYLYVNVCVRDCIGVRCATLAPFGTVRPYDNGHGVDSIDFLITSSIRTNNLKLKSKFSVYSLRWL